MRERSVFLNVPFDSEYEPLYLAHIAGLIGLGFLPRCVLEIPSAGKAIRLDRILQCIRACKYSVHDLSRCGVDPRSRCARFNMPFELGLAVASQFVDRDHKWVLFETKSFRLQKSLGDMNGFDPHIHRGTPVGVLQALRSAFQRDRGRPNAGDLRALLRVVNGMARELKASSRSKSLYDASCFRELVRAASLFADRRYRPTWS